MAAAAEPPPGAARLGDVVGVDGDDRDLGAVQQQVELPAAGLSLLRLDHDGGFEQRRRGHEPRLVLFDRGAERFRLGLVEEQREERRGVEHHQRASPCSS